MRSKSKNTGNATNAIARAKCLLLVAAAGVQFEHELFRVSAVEQMSFMIKGSLLPNSDADRKLLM